MQIEFAQLQIGYKGTALVHVAQLQCSSEASVAGVLTFQALATFVRQRDKE